MILCDGCNSLTGSSTKGHQACYMSKQFINMDLHKCSQLPVPASISDSGLKPFDGEDGARELQPEPSFENLVSTLIWHHTVCIVDVPVLLSLSTLK